MDEGVTRVGWGVRNPGLWIGTVLELLRIGELGSVRRKIEVLEGTG